MSQSETIDQTHDAALTSWVPSANLPGSDFPIQNLPLGLFRKRGDTAVHPGAAIGDCILDIAGCLDKGLLEGKAARAAEACTGGSLNGLMALDPVFRSELRQALSLLLRSDCEAIGTRPHSAETLVVPMAGADMLLPAAIGDYTDFYASIYHARRVGSMFRPENPLLPNYKHIPVAYHGRASSIVVSGTPVRRPSGQVLNASGLPERAPTRLLDYELELGFFVGPGNPLGEPMPIGKAREHIFGFCLVNDWSARDIQKWEYQPLGPFLAKSFATSISPWIITMEALAPFRSAAFRRDEGDPPPLAYLQSGDEDVCGGLDIQLEVYLSSLEMRRRDLEPVRLSRGNFRDMYWTVAQMITHHASNGCNLRPGDLIASGTISGPARDSCGCLLELAWRGTEPLALPTGEQRRFLEDFDEVIFRAFCSRPGFARIGFGECRGIVLPAVD